MQLLNMCDKMLLVSLIVLLRTLVGISDTPAELVIEMDLNVSSKSFSVRSLN